MLVDLRRSAPPSRTSLPCRRGGPCPPAGWSGRAGTAASGWRAARPTSAIACSSRRLPMKHQGQTTSETTSTVSGSRSPALIPRSTRSSARRRRATASPGCLTRDQQRPPILRRMEERDQVEAGDQHAVERAHRGDEILAVGRREQRVDHRVDRRIVRAGEIERAGIVHGRRGPAIVLLVAGRQRRRDRRSGSCRSRSP